MAYRREQAEDHHQHPHVVLQHKNNITIFGHTLCLAKRHVPRQYCHPCRGNTATHAMAILPPMPWQYCHPCHGNTATHAVAILPPMPWQYCHPCHGNTATHAVAILPPMPWQYCHTCQGSEWKTLCNIPSPAKLMVPPKVSDILRRHFFALSRFMLCYPAHHNLMTSFYWLKVVTNHKLSYNSPRVNLLSVFFY